MKLSIEVLVLMLLVLAVGCAGSENSPTLSPFQSGQTVVAATRVAEAAQLTATAPLISAGEAIALVQEWQTGRYPLLSDRLDCFQLHGDALEASLLPDGNWNVSESGESASGKTYTVFSRTLLVQSHNSNC